MNKKILFISFFIIAVGLFIPDLVLGSLTEKTGEEICQMRFTDVYGETRHPDDWCWMGMGLICGYEDCKNDVYYFCHHYNDNFYVVRFGCRCYDHGWYDIMPECYCNPGNVSVTHCPHGCIGFNCHGDGCDGEAKCFVRPEPTITTPGIREIDGIRATDVSPIEARVEFDRLVTGFEKHDIEVTVNGTNNRVDIFRTLVDNREFLFNFTPDRDGEVEIIIPAGAAEDKEDGSPSAGARHKIIFDTIAPEVKVEARAISPTRTTPIPITIRFTEPVFGFTVDDITVDDANIRRFSGRDGDKIFTFDAYPTATPVTVTVDIAGGVATDRAGNLNTAATQFSIDFRGDIVDPDPDPDPVNNNAVNNDVVNGIRIRPPIVHETFYDLIRAFINFIFIVSLVLAPLMIIIGAVYFLTAAGDPQKIEAGKRLILWTLVGFVIILLARGIVEFLRRAFGIE